MDDSVKVKHWDDMYDLPLGDIPWEIEQPPDELVELIKSKQITGGKALDIACGTGNYSFYLAKHGFIVTGIDFSKKALDIAKSNNKKLNLAVTFKLVDVTKISTVAPDETFDFILDYSILHHLEPAITNDYAEQCARLLKSDGKLLLVCYSDKDEFANGDRSATGKYGNTMFYRTADEIRYAYKDLKEISYKETRLGKRKQHIAHCFVFQKT